ncbi:M48 family metalloprotease [Micromonospora sp. NPDC050397]|uniref:M48 family metalloprotease n=1 Tax=Micromonospora sp. NPDC050397 TaxID=3364279 RepID=UPI00384CB882
MQATVRDVSGREFRQRTGWLYLLIAVALLGLGMSAANVALTNERSLAGNWTQTAIDCQRRFPWTPTFGAVTDAGDRETYERFQECLRPAQHRRVFGMLGGAALVAVGVLTVMLVVPAVDHHRLRRHRGLFLLPGADERFARLCDEYGLTGRHRPHLLVAGPPVRQAFTTARLWRRPVVVLPAAVAVAYRDPARFDPVVRHELGHVLAGDVTWVSAVRGLNWLLVPVVTAAVVPGIVAGGLSGQALTMWAKAVLLAGVTVVLAAGLLRRRELDADRHAALTGPSGPLLALLSGAPGTPARRPGWTPRRWLARHPSPAARIAALHSPAAREGGPVQGFVTGLVALPAMTVAADPADTLAPAAHPLLAADAAAVAGALVLGGVLFPALLRRAVTARRAGLPVSWWRPVLGVAAGLLLGNLLAPAWLAPGVVVFPVPAQESWTNLWLAVVTSLAGAAAVSAWTGLAALFATVTATTARPARRLWWATWLAGVCLAGAALWPATVLGTLWLTGRAAVPAFLLLALPQQWWPWLAMALPTVALLLLAHSAGRLSRLRRELTLPAGAALVAVVLGVGITALHLVTVTAVDRGDSDLRLAQELWWIAVLTGLALFVAVVARRGHAALPHAVVVSWASTALVALAAHWQTPPELQTGMEAQLRVRIAVVWLIYLTLLAAPLAVVATSVPRLRIPPRIRPGRARPWLFVTTVGLAVMVSGGLVGVVGVPGGYLVVESTTDPTAVPATTVTAPPSPSWPPGPTPTGRSGSILTQAEAQAVAETFGEELPQLWRPGTPPSAPENFDVRPVECGPLVRNQFLDELAPHRQNSALAYFTQGNPIQGSTLEITVTSYAVPVAESVFAGAERARLDCPRFVMTAGAVRITGTPRARPAPALGDHSWRVYHEMENSLADGLPLPGSGGTAYAMVGVGNTRIAVTMLSTGEPVDEALFEQALARTVAAL